MELRSGWVVPWEVRSVRRRRRGPEPGDTASHLGDFAPLALDDVVGKSADLRVLGLRAVAGQQGYGVMWDHCPHVADITDFDLTAYQPETAGEHQDRPGQEQDVELVWQYMSHIKPMMIMAMAASISIAIQARVWLCST
jgi:hypothetical protein